SVAGYWHAIYSAVQMWIILLFSYVSAVVSRHKLSRASRFVRTGWIILLLYTSLSFGDFASKQTYVVRNGNLIAGLKSDWLLMVPFPVVVLAFYWFVATTRRPSREIP